MMKHHLAPLTSVRFFAAALVVFEHFFGFEYGHAGVSFFYILSGFILTYNYVGKLSSQSDIVNFYYKRVARLYPLHLLTLLAAIPTALLIDFRYHGTEILPALLCNVLLLQSFIPIKLIYFGFNSVSWSISDEAFFYAMFPILGIALSRIRRTWAWIVLCFIWLILIVTMLQWRMLGLNPVHQHWFFYINPLIRITEFVAGMLIGLWFVTTQRHAASIVYEVFAILIAIAAIITAYYIPEQAASLTYGLLFIAPSLLIIYVFANGVGAISAFLSKPFMVLLGEASFALYMTHQLFLRYMVLIFGGSVTTKVISLLMTVPIAVLSYKMFEKPSQRWLLRRLTVQTG